MGCPVSAYDAECPACGKDSCATCSPEQRRLAEIQADVDWAISQTRARVAAFPKPRDSMPLAGYSKDWSK